MVIDEPVNVLCMKWGNKFAPYYVNRLYNMVSKNLSLDFRFICFTDDANNICNKIEIKPLPKLNLPKNIPERGWRKLTMLKQPLADIKGQALFLDLDIVIVDSIDVFFKDPGDFFIMQDGRNKKKLEGNSSVFRFEVGKFWQILANFEKNIAKIREECRHEQAYLSREIHKLNKMSFWRQSWVVSFKYHCCNNILLSAFSVPTIPKGAKIIVFHGHPTPEEAIKGISGKWYRKIKPAHWIKNYWQ